MSEGWTKTHVCIALDRILELTLKGEKILTHNDGSNMTEREIYQLVKEEKAMGYEYFSPCESRRADGRCAGHPLGEEAKQ